MKLIHCPDKLCPYPQILKGRGILKMQKMKTMSEVKV